MSAARRRVGSLAAMPSCSCMPTASTPVAAHRVPPPPQRILLLLCTTANGCFKKADQNGGNEFQGETSYDSDYHHPGIYESQPSWQSSVPHITNYCTARAIGDVSADADPNTGVAVYDSYVYQGQSGWLIFGGTSVASPIIASVYALAGNAASVNYGSYPYSHTSSLYDVTSGSNGSCGNDLCNATTGWDGPTGNGTPNGTGAF